MFMHTLMLKYISHLQQYSSKMQYQDIGDPKSGLYPLRNQQISIPSTLQSKKFPQQLSSFPILILVTFAISNALKLYVPFAIENLYLSISPSNFVYPSATFIIVIVCSYYAEIKANNQMEKYKIQVKSILSQRVMRATLRTPFQDLENKQKKASSHSSWCKISENVNIYVNNYYASYLTIIFETLKALFIVFYLFFTIGKVTFVGLAIGGMIVQFLQLISKKIENVNFVKLRLMQLKTKILTQYFTRIVDYQMSWLDGFIADRVEHLENQYQKNLRKAKLLDAWCVGLWQFTQIGISSVVLCLYYFYNSQGNTVQPATVIYLFQMLTFPMNAISWNIAGLHNAERAIRQLSESQRNIQVEKKREKAIQKFEYGFQITYIQSNIQPSKIYALTSDDASTLRKLALSLSKKPQKIGIAQQNSFLMQSFMEGIFLLPQQYLSSESIKQSKQELIKILQICKCSQIPMQNPVSTYSGGQKMRVSLARAMFNGRVIVVDSQLMSLDKNTRAAVYAGMKEYVEKQGMTVIIRGKKGDTDIDNNAHYFIRVEQKFSRAKFEVNKGLKPIIKRSADQQRQLQKQRKQIQQKVNQQISKLQTIQIFHPSINFDNNKSQLSQQSQQQLIPEPTLPTVTAVPISNANPSQLNSSSEQQKAGSFRPVSSASSAQSRTLKQPRYKPLTRKLKLSLSTLKFYYGHKMSHALFVLALIGMYSVGNYYNYFVNLMQVCDDKENMNKECSASYYAYSILYITVVYVICIILRSYLFAAANLKQSERICHLTNKLLVYNHISFYSKQHIIDPTPQQPPMTPKLSSTSSSSEPASQQSSPFSPPTNQPAPQSQQTTNSIQKLVYLCTSDQKNVNTGYPFDTNILWNNIATVASCLIVVALEVPIVILLVIGFIMAIRKIQNDYRVRNQGLTMISKEEEIQLMKSINYIEAAGINLHVYKKVPQFIYKFTQNLQSVHSTNAQQNALSIWMQINFRIYMLLFLCICILLFWAKDLIFDNNQTDKIRKSAQMSVMVRYVLLLADYVFYLARSWADCRGKAISIERIRRCVENIGVIKGSFERLKRSNRKKQQFIRFLQQKDAPFNKPFINLSNFSFQYDNRTPNVLENINLYIKQNDKIVLKGKTGSGKTSLFKILMGLYPQSYFPQSSIHLLAFSSQHPLNMGQCSLLQKLDPYRILQIAPVNIKNRVMEKARKIFEKYEKNKNGISFEDQVKINNLRAYLYGFKGLAIYDEPQFVFEDSGTYMIVTHHGKFKNNFNLMLEKGRIFEVADKEDSKSKSKQKGKSPIKNREDSKAKPKQK